jgi:UDP-N-acetylglucosamine acyltransferase
MSIHPTAIVHPKAHVHENAIVGPFCIVEEGVTIGDGTILHSSVVLHSGTKVGKNNQFFHGAAMGGLPQDLSFKPETHTELIIGDNNLIREGAIFHRGTKKETPTTIGNGNYLMGNMHIAHDCKFGNNNIVVQNSIIAGVVEVGSNVFISGLVAIHQFAKVGDYAMLAGCSKIVKDVPPYATIDGNPATIIGLNTVGLKRAGFNPEIRAAIKSAYKTIYHKGLNTKQAIAQLQEENSPFPEVRKILDFFLNSKRGVTAHRKISSGSDLDE